MPSSFIDSLSQKSGAGRNGRRGRERRREPPEGQIL